MPAPTGVPVGYLVTVALVTWCTLFALAPPRPRRSSPSNLSFWWGFWLNELPFLAIWWLLATTLLVIGEGLGPGWRTAVDAGTAAGRRRLPWARILFWPFPVRPRQVERVANLRYGDAGRWNLLDLYRRRSGPAGGPTLVYLHGGAFRGGVKSREARPLLYRLASQGWVCVSANYRLGRAARFPDHLVDAKRVIAWVREHGPGYGADPAALFVAGSSAGGHLAAMTALTPNDPTFQPGFERADTFVEGLASSSSSPVVYAELPGAQHVFDMFHSPRFEAVVAAIEAFTGASLERREPLG